MKEFSIGQRVRVRTDYEGPNRRVPAYVKGKIGIVLRVHGEVANYRHDHADDWGALYSVLFDGSSRGEKLIVDLHQPWLESTS
jgi:hypothetical protein